ncbi:ATP-dependent RNA helicase RhlE [Posidoniimonas polymericola]|uniref:ATP-dependent RNA helicase RhlE n=1 Tax=Posidoniimonas polymericola TaxID=2528002 RepID=A0A5C5YI61_9BACT|nr:DEAD/DEAH box helicase [Posidoniimonas polymericola]TWT74452.1 ATP-dependent RNA helicase RhlE [Posidoniimonas polymericola]
MDFSELGLADAFLQATDLLGYATATPIQAKAIPVVLQGGDLIGCAQTGTGKTAAFTLPTLQRLLESMPPRPPKQTIDGKRQKPRRQPRPLRALVLSPTRELAAQIGASFDKYGKFTPLRQTVIFGGVSQYHQVKALQNGVDTLVATPGRLLDLKDQGHIDLSQVEILIFDEADQMLDMGFLPALKRIVAAVPSKRQTLMFSATMPNEIRELAQQWLTRPDSIEIGAVSKPADKVTQSVHMVDKKKKHHLLAHFLKATRRDRTLVFSRTKHGADKIVKHLEREGLKAAAIHGNKSQNARSRALAQFKGKNPPVLVATDIAARGLDISGVSHVINYDLPETAETYVHRIGRTARAGAEGAAVSFCAGDEHGLLKQIERLVKRSIPVEATVPGFEPTDPISHGTGYKRSGGQGGQGGGGKPRSGQGGRPSGKGYGKSRSYGKSRPNGSTGGGSGAGHSGGESAAGERRSGQKQRRRRRGVGSAAGQRPSRPAAS